MKTVIKYICYNKKTGAIEGVHSDDELKELNDLEKIQHSATEFMIDETKEIK